MKNVTLGTLNGIHQSLQKVIKYPFAIVGGAVRDVMLGKGDSVKDIDVCITLPDLSDSKRFKIIKELNPVIAEHFYSDADKMICLSVDLSDTIQHTFSANIGQSDRLITVYRLPDGPHNFPLELLYTALSPKEFVETFDFGICQTWVGLYGLKALPAFRKDMVDKTITFVRKGEDPTPYERHLKRIMTKYPGYSIRGMAPPCLDKD